MLEDARSLTPFHRFAQHAISGIDVRENIPRTSRVNKDAVAVVIDNREYLKSDVSCVDFALDDAHIIKEYLLRSIPLPSTPLARAIWIPEISPGTLLKCST